MIIQASVLFHNSQKSSTFYKLFSINTWS